MLPLDPGASEAIRSRLEVSTAATADRVEAAALAGLAAHSDDVCPSVAGGNQRVALALAAELGSIVHLSSPVESVTWGEGPTRLRAGGAEVEVDRIVITVPASVIGRIVFDRPLPEALRAAYSAVEYGHAAKLFVPLTRVPVTECRPLGAGAVLELDRHRSRRRSARRQRIRGLVARPRPASARRTGRQRGSNLSNDCDPTSRSHPATPSSSAGTTIRGSKPRTRARRPSVAAWGPAGPFHACGEHTHDTGRALMDGALASGLRAAQEVLDAGEPR